MKTRVFTITCLSCKDEIYSRARHDLQTCSCEDVSVDGGFEYNRVSFKNATPKTRVRYIPASRQELFDDWNNDINKYGKIEKKIKSH